MNTTEMTRNERGRITGITARILDQGKLADAIADELVRNGKNSIDRAKIEPMDAVVLEGRTSGTFAVVNDEGVGGYEINDHVRVWFCYGIDGLYIHDTMVPSSDILEAVTDTEVDLAEFIRTFGDRLDTNHSIWANWHLNN